MNEVYLVDLDKIKNLYFETDKLGIPIYKNPDDYVKAIGFCECLNIIRQNSTEITEGELEFIIGAVTEYGEEYMIESEAEALVVKLQSLGGE